MLAELPTVTEDEVRSTLAKFGIDDEDARLVRMAGDLLRDALVPMVDDFYEWLSHHEEYRTFFASNPRTLERVRKLQHQHWVEFFQARLDTDYFAARRRIGAVHANIDLPNDIYYAGMCVSVRLLLESLFEIQPAPPALGGMVQAVQKLSILDTFLTADEIYRIQRSKLMASGKALMEMSTPVTPIWEGILLLPVVGIIDSVRTQEIMNKSLAKISETRSRVFVLDISGVGAVDTAVANQLIKITKATRLMGCESIISGISPAIARTLVELGVQVGDVRTTATLRDALELALRSTGEGALIAGAEPRR